MNKKPMFVAMASLLTMLTPPQVLLAEPAWDLFEDTWYGFNAGTFDDSRYPSAVEMADLDGDGDLDAVLSTYTWNPGFIVLPNDGEGFFGPPIHYAASAPAEDVELADVDGDGDFDVVFPNTGFPTAGTTLSLFLNQGDGTFGAPSGLTVGNGPAGVVADDLDLDGDLDLICANYDRIGLGSTVSVLLGGGDGTFADQMVFPAGDSPFKVATGDLDGDGLPEIVVANDYSKLNILTNTGGSDFSSRLELTLISGIPYANDIFPAVVLADFDNDGDLDIAYTSTRTWDEARGLVRILRNDGFGSFGVPEEVPLTDFTAGGTHIRADDLDGDGWLDLVTASYSGRTSDGYHVVMNDGIGHFLPAYRNPAGQATFNVFTGDVDLDGDVDIVTADNYSLELTVHRNDGGAAFPVPTGYLTTFGCTHLDTADIDGDGDLDVVSSASSVGATTVPVAVLKNLGDGSFGPHSELSGEGGVGAKFRDLNGDGFADIVYASGRTTPPYDMHTAINQGDGTFGPVQTWSQGSCGWADIEALDLDNDDDLDVVVTEWLGCPGIPESARRIFINQNRGDGTFFPPIIEVVNPFPGDIGVGDFNDDGNVDLVTTHSTSLDIHLGTGTLDLLPPVAYEVGQSPFDIEVHDFNGDGVLDLASCNNGTITSMSVLLGVGDGTFLPAQTLPGAYSPDLNNSFGIAAGDVDLDGWPDIIVGNQASNQLSIYRNQGDGTFGYYLRVGAYYSASSPQYADFTGDGVADVAVLVGLPPSGGGRAVAVLRGRGAVTSTDESGRGSTAVALAQNAPNPFKRATTIRYALATQSTVRLEIFNVSGERVEVLADGVQSPGQYQAVFRGKGKPNGVYYYRLEIDGEVQTKRMILLR